MKIALEDILTGGLGLVVVLLANRRRAGPGRMDAPARFLALFWNAFSASRPHHGGSVGQVSLSRTG